MQAAAVPLVWDDEGRVRLGGKPSWWAARVKVWASAQQPLMKGVCAPTRCSQARTLQVVTPGPWSERRCAGTPGVKKSLVRQCGPSGLTGVAPSDVSRQVPAAH